MTKQAARVWSAFVLATTLATQPVSAQKQPKGWPDSGGNSATTTTKSASAVKTTRPVSAVKLAPAVAKAVLMKPARSKARATVAAIDAVTAEVLSALHQQTELLKRLSFEIEAQRSLMTEQQDKIHALELRAAMAAPAPTTVETGGTRLKVIGLFNGLGEGFHDAGKREQKTWVSRGAYRSSPIKGLQTNYIRKTFAGVITPRDVFMTNIQTTW